MSRPATDPLTHNAIYYLQALLYARDEPGGGDDAEVELDAIFRRECGRFGVDPETFENIVAALL